MQPNATIRAKIDAKVQSQSVRNGLQPVHTHTHCIAHTYTDAGHAFSSIQLDSLASFSPFHAQPTHPPPFQYTT